MKISFPIALFFCCLAIAGCQKEPSAELPPGSGPENSGDGNRLVRMVYQYSPTDSAYTEFFYDAQGRWMGQRTVGDDNAVLTESAEIRVTRNSAGIITSYTVKEDDGSGGVDNTMYTVHYDAGAKRYTSRVTEFLTNGGMLIDSTVFVINNGRMATQRFIYKEKTSGIFLEVGKLDFVYDGAGNPVNITTYSSDPGTGRTKKEAEILLQFDGKTAALNLGVEALVMDQIFFVSPNNISKVTFRDLTDPAAPEEDQISIAYQYHPSNKPRSAEISLDGGKVPLVFRYQ